MNIFDQLRRDEGVRPGLYSDSLGIPTFGVGFTFPLDDTEIEFILEHRVDKADSALCSFSWYRALDSVRQGAMINMAYNMGVERLLGFVHMISFLSDRNWKDAAHEALSSQWARQVGARALRVTKQIETGEWQ